MISQNRRYNKMYEEYQQFHGNVYKIMQFTMQKAIFFSFNNIHIVISLEILKHSKTRETTSYILINN